MFEVGGRIIRVSSKQPERGGGSGEGRGEGRGEGGGERGRGGGRGAGKGGEGGREQDVGYVLLLFKSKAGEVHTPKFWDAPKPSVFWGMYFSSLKVKEEKYIPQSFGVCTSPPLLLKRRSTYPKIWAAPAPPPLLPASPPAPHPANQPPATPHTPPAHPPTPPRSPCVPFPCPLSHPSPPLLSVSALAR